MTRYMMQRISYKGATPDDAFVFDAKNEKDATDKVWKWARRHSFIVAEDVTCRKCTSADEWPAHNEWVG